MFTLRLKMVRSMFCTNPRLWTMFCTNPILWTMFCTNPLLWKMFSTKFCYTQSATRCLFRMLKCLRFSSCQACSPLSTLFHTCSSVFQSTFYFSYCLFIWFLNLAMRIPRQYLHLSPQLHLLGHLITTWLH